MNEYPFAAAESASPDPQHTKTCSVSVDPQHTVLVEGHFSVDPQHTVFVEGHSVEGHVVEHARDDAEPGFAVLGSPWGRRRIVQGKTENCGEVTCWVPGYWAIGVLGYRSYKKITKNPSEREEESIHTLCPPSKTVPGTTFLAVPKTLSVHRSIGYRSKEITALGVY